MNLNADDLRVAHRCAAALIESRRQKRQPVPPDLLRFYNRVVSAIQCLSDTGQENKGPAAQLEKDELITPPQAAKIMNCSARQAQRLGPELGQLVGKTWVFSRRAVEQYARETETV
jgi:hypothetical protein